jgi:hypothetical protein
VDYADSQAAVPEGITRRGSAGRRTVESEAAVKPEKMVREQSGLTDSRALTCQISGATRGRTDRPENCLTVMIVILWRWEEDMGNVQVKKSGPRG